MNSKTASTSERIDGLEARCQALESIVEQLTARIEMLEAPTTVTPVPDIDVVGSLAPGGGTTEGTPLDVTETHQGSVDIDDLLREAQQMGQGIYDEDIQEVINLGVMQPPTTDVRLDVEDYCLFGGEDFRQVLQETAAPAAATSDLGEMQQVLQGTTPDTEAVPAATTAATLAAATPEATTSTNTDGDEYALPGGGEIMCGKSLLHLVLGDSIALYVTLPVGPGEEIMNLAIRGNTWEREEDLIEQHVAEWQQKVKDRGTSPGRIFIWLGGNDAYGRPGNSRAGLSLQVVRRVLRRLSVMTDIKNVVLAGPTPRLWADCNQVWEQTAAFGADKDLQVEASRCGAAYIPYIGRALTCMRRRRHVLKPNIVKDWFAPDGVHLTQEGHQRVTERFRKEW